MMVFDWLWRKILGDGGGGDTKKEEKETNETAFLEERDTRDNKRKVAAETLSRPVSHNKRFKASLSSSNKPGLATEKKEWDRVYDRVLAFLNKTGNLTFDKRNRELTEWVVVQRDLLARGKKDSLTTDQRAKLSVLFPEEKAATSNSAKTTTPTQRKKMTTKRTVQVFDDMFPKLVAWKKATGHTKVSKTSDPDLYKWVNSLRRMHKKNGSKVCNMLPKEYMKKLESIDFTWESSRGRPVNVIVGSSNTGGPSFDG